ncbi:MAG TPA: tetratricopeptide repeat protein [Sedimentisphaerales bacterium]|nr:tetratricopeptide repeat protein [Sedimentisphaerales bacterium]
MANWEDEVVRFAPPFAKGSSGKVRKNSETNTTIVVKFFRMYKHQTIVICVLLAVCTVVVYWRVLSSDFVNFDDQMYVTENSHVQSGLTAENLVWAFTSYDVAYWHPLTWLSHILDCELFGLKAGGHHLTSLILHIANSLLVFWVLRRMTGAMWRSAFVAALFALHPFNVDSAAWIAERKNVLSTFFWLLTMWAYVSYARRGGVGRYLLTVGLYALGLMAKPMLVTLPFVMLLLDYWPLKRYQSAMGGGENGAAETEAAGRPFQRAARLLAEKIPLFALSALSVFSFCWAVERPSAAVSAEMVPVKLRIANALVSYVDYMAKMIWPRGLAVYYPYPTQVPSWQVVTSLLLLGCVSALVLLALRGKPYLAVGWFWYLGTLVPVIGLYQAGLWPAIADRWAYVPLIGLFIMIAWGGGDVAKRLRLPKLAPALLACAWLSALMAATWFQVGYWRNGATLFEHALDVTSGNYIAHYNLGNIMLRQDRTAEAIEHYKKAAAFHPKYVDAYYNLGIALSAAGRYPEAIKEYRTVLRLRADHKKVFSRMGDALARNGQIDEAIVYYNKSLEQNEKDAEVLNNLALALVKKGQTDEAVKYYTAALEVNPDSVEVLNNLGNALVKQGRFDQATTHYEKALRLQPGFAETSYNLANALRQAGRFDESAEYYREALRLNPDNTDAHYGLGLALAELNEYDEAATHLRKAIQLDPNFAQAHYSLGLIFFHQQKIDEAIEQFRRVLDVHPNDAEMHCNLGVLLVQKGDVDAAIDEFRTALRLAPDFTKARTHLEAALAAKAAPAPL